MITLSTKLIVFERECRCLPFQFPGILFSAIDTQITVSVCVSDLEFKNAGAYYTQMLTFISINKKDRFKPKYLKGLDFSMNNLKADNREKLVCRSCHKM